MSTTLARSPLYRPLRMRTQEPASAAAAAAAAAAADGSRATVRPTRRVGLPPASSRLPLPGPRASSHSPAWPTPSHPATHPHSQPPARTPTNGLFCASGHADGVHHLAQGHQLGGAGVEDHAQPPHRILDVRLLVGLNVDVALQGRGRELDWNGIERWEAERKAAAAAAAAEEREHTGVLRLSCCAIAAIPALPCSPAAAPLPDLLLPRLTAGPPHCWPSPGCPRLPTAVHYSEARLEMVLAEDSLDEQRRALAPQVVALLQQAHHRLALLPLPAVHHPELGVAGGGLQRLLLHRAAAAVLLLAVLLRVPAPGAAANVALHQNSHQRKCKAGRAAAMPRAVDCGGPPLLQPIPQFAPHQSQKPTSPPHSNAHKPPHTPHSVATPRG